MKINIKPFLPSHKKRYTEKSMTKIRETGPNEPELFTHMRSRTKIKLSVANTLVNKYHRLNRAAKYKNPNQTMQMAVIMVSIGLRLKRILVIVAYIAIRHETNVREINNSSSVSNLSGLPMTLMISFFQRSIRENYYSQQV